MAELAGKSIVIVGGTAGMGLSAARACVRAGARVVAIGREAAEVEMAGRELGGAVIGITGEAQDPETAPGAIAAAVERFGRLDALFHVAGGSGRRMGDGPLHELSDEGWDATLRLNLKSVFLSNRAAVRQFLAQGRGGVVLNMGSVVGFSPSPRYFNTLAYAAAKSAMVGFTKMCAATYAPSNIRFNLIAPALTDTPMSQRAMNDPAIQRFIQSKQPLDGGRAARPDDLDAAVVFLLSDGAKFVTGQVLCVDGGWCVSEGQLQEGA